MLVQNKLEEIYDKIKNLEDKIDEQNKKLDIITNILNNDVKINCDKMSEHIDFISSVYERVKTPMYFICDKLSGFRYLTPS